MSRLERFHQTMIVRRLAARRLAPKGSTAPQPERKLAGGFVLAIVAAGTLAGGAAWFDVWPFGNVQALIHDVFNSGSAEVPAQVIFPAVPPVHKTVDVYDPPPAAAPAPPGPVGAPQPVGGGEPGDGGGGGDD